MGSSIQFRPQIIEKSSILMNILFNERDWLLIIGKNSQNLMFHINNKSYIYNSFIHNIDIDVFRMR